MPIYEFRCDDCGHVLEALRRIGEGSRGLECPACGSKALSQLLSSFATSGSGSEPSCSSGGSCSAGGGLGGGGG